MSEDLLTGETYEVVWLAPEGWESITFTDRKDAEAFFTEHRPANLRQGTTLLAVRH